MFNICVVTHANGVLVYLQMLLQMGNMGSWSLDGLGKIQKLLRFQINI